MSIEAVASLLLLSIMARSIQFWLALSLLAIATSAEMTLVPRPLLAQASTSSSTCYPETPPENKVNTSLEQSRSAIDNRDSVTAIRFAQEAFPAALQLQNKRAQADIIQQWFIDTNEGYPISRFQRLMQLAEKQQQTAQIRPLLDQFLRLAQQLNAGTSVTKTRGLAAIARHYGTLGQSQTAQSALAQAREAARPIQGPIFTATALMDVAEGYAAIAQPQSAQIVLAQVEQAIRQWPPNTSEPNKFILLERLATTYARIGNDTKANQIAAQLPKNSDSQSVALRGIAEAYIQSKQLNKAEQLLPAITSVSQKVPVLGQLAAAYHNAKQPDKATQLFRQAIQLSQSETVTRDPILQTALTQSLVNAHLQAGRRDEALQLVKALPAGSQRELLKSVMIAYSQAGQTNKVETLLSEQLSAILALSDSWDQRIELGSLYETVIETRQFDWIRKQWNSLAKIDYGPQDQDIVKLAKAYAQTGQYAQAAEWARKLPLDTRPELRIKLLTAIAQSAHQAGNTAWAKQLLQQTLASVDPLTKVYQAQIEQGGGNLFERDRFKPKALANIAVVYAQMGEAATVRQLLQQVIQLDNTMSDPSIAAPTDNPFAVFTEAGQYVGALQLAQGTQNPEIRESRLRDSASGLLKQNRFDLVLPLVDQLSAANQKTQLLLAIAQRYGELQQVDKALPLLNRAFQIAQTIPGEESQVDRLGTDGLTVIELENDRGSLIEAIAIQYARFKQPAQALKVANTLQAKPTRDLALQRVRCATPQR